MIRAKRCGESRIGRSITHEYYDISIEAANGRVDYGFMTTNAVVKLVEIMQLLEIDVSVETK